MSLDLNDLTLRARSAAKHGLPLEVSPEELAILKRLFPPSPPDPFDFSARSEYATFADVRLVVSPVLSPESEKQ